VSAAARWSLRRSPVTVSCTGDAPQLETANGSLGASSKPARHGGAPESRQPVLLMATMSTSRSTADCTRPSPGCSMA
jgi:hypothetical protein